MSEPLTVRAAVASDVPALIALVNSAYRGDSSRAGWTTEADILGGIRVDEARVRDAITGDGHVVLLHEADGAIVACVQLERTGETCYVGMLTTRPTLQGAGLGRRMLATAERWAAGHWHSREAHMTVLAQRPELVAWYERRGYARTGEQKPFPYGDERWGIPAREDLVFEVLSKPLHA